MKKNLNLVSMFVCAMLLAAAILPSGSAFAATGPVTSDMLVTPAVSPLAIGGSVTLTANIDASGTSGLNIASASYTLNGGAPVAMSAFDGAFDSPTEEATASFAVIQGLNYVCVSGTDTGFNTGDPVCITFTAASTLYTFKGFKPPVKMNIAVNKAKAGSNIPLKWNLTLIADGSPALATSFVKVESFAVDCVTGAGDPGTAVQEFGPGKSFFKAQKNGSFLFNWKTPKAYKGTCRVMFVLFDDNSVSPLVEYQFK
jgi:hypothetical protein